MIFDLIFIAVLVFMIISGKKRGLVNVILGLVSGILAIILAFTFQADIKEAVSKTDFYTRTQTEVCTAVEEKISDAAEDMGLLAPLVEEGLSAQEITDRVMGSCVSVLIFIAAFIVLRIAGAVLNGIFHLPVLKFFNGIAGMLWGAVIVIAVTYTILALAGQIPALCQAEFFKSQMQSSQLIKNMYENNLLVKIFII